MKYNTAMRYNTGDFALHQVLVRYILKKLVSEMNLDSHHG